MLDTAWRTIVEEREQVGGGRVGLRARGTIDRQLLDVVVLVRDASGLAAHAASLVDRILVDGSRGVDGREVELDAVVVGRKLRWERRQRHPLGRWGRWRWRWGTERR